MTVRGMNTTDPIVDDHSKRVFASRSRNPDVVPICREDMEALERLIMGKRSDGKTMGVEQWIEKERG